MNQQTSRPAAMLTPETHARLLALAARWKATPTISIIPITHDRLVAMALQELEKAIPWQEAEAQEPGTNFDTLSKVVALLPTKGVV